MGLLDDAIREHLDLKRRRGADPTEVEQLEREALGPVRRAAQASEEEVPDQDVLEQDGFEQDGLEHQGGEPAIFDDQADEPYTQIMRPEAGATEYHEEQDHGLAEPLQDEAPFADEAALTEAPQHEPVPRDDSEKSWSHEPAEAW
jgi:hypothetical protein